MEMSESLFLKMVQEIERIAPSINLSGAFLLATNHHQRDDHTDGLCKDCAKGRICRIKLKIPHEQVDECDIETLIPKLAGTTC